jgi:hypothetical protein
MADPLFAGVVKDKTMDLFPATTLVITGGSGTARGVNAIVATCESPRLFVAIIYAL